jgi:hypothetical protein
MPGLAPGISFLMLKSLLHSAHDTPVVAGLVPAVRVLLYSPQQQVLAGERS